MTPPTSAPSRPAPTNTAATSPATTTIAAARRERPGPCAERSRARVEVRAPHEQRTERDHQQHGERRLELVAEAVEARPRARVDAEQRADDAAASRHEVGAVGDEPRRAPGTSGPRGQRTNRSVSAASANDPPTTITISPIRVGASQPVEQEQRQHPQHRQAADAHPGADAAAVGHEAERQRQRRPREQQREDRRRAPAADDPQARFDRFERVRVARPLGA